MSKEAFVYLWKNKTNGRKYVGYHKGSQDDGYISSTSNDNFWSDIKVHEFQREILFEGTTNECLKFEQDYLKKIDLRSDEWYNNARGAEVIFTQEVRDKIRNHHLGKSSGMLGKKHSEETKKKQQIALLDRVFTQDHLEKLRRPNKNKGKKASENFRKLVSERTSDKNIYSFLNVNTNQIFTGTRAEFSKSFNIAKHNIVGLVHRKTKILANTWVLAD